MSFNQDAFNQFIIKHSGIGFFDHPITLKSGRKSNWYINWRSITSDTFLLDQTCDFIIDFVKSQHLDCDCFYGVPEGATKIGLITQYKWAKQSETFAEYSHVLPMGRSKPKAHGAIQDRYFIGVPNGRVIVIEDVTTTGGSLIQTLEQLKDSNIQVVAAVGLSHRMEKRDNGQSVEQAVQDCGVPYFAMSQATNLLPEIIKNQKPADAIVSAIIKEFQTYGTEALKL